MPHFFASDVYHDYIRKIRQKNFEDHLRGIPLEYFEWERVFVDEIHECLCTSKDELAEAKAKNDDNAGFFQEKNRRAGREVRRKPFVLKLFVFVSFYITASFLTLHVLTVPWNNNEEYIPKAPW